MGDKERQEAKRNVKKWLAENATLVHRTATRCPRLQAGVRSINHDAGIAGKVARMRPMGVAKG